jgi:hypothetical protein
MSGDVERWRDRSAGETILVEMSVDEDYRASCASPPGASIVTMIPGIPWPDSVVYDRNAGLLW